MVTLLVPFRGSSDGRGRRGLWGLPGSSFPLCHTVVLWWGCCFHAPELPSILSLATLGIVTMAQMSLDDNLAGLS